MSADVVLLIAGALIGFGVAVLFMTWYEHRLYGECWECRRHRERDESLCHFCGRVTRPWLTDDETWALAEPALGQYQACLVCFYNALFEAGHTNGAPLRVRLPGMS